MRGGVPCVAGYVHTTTSMYTWSGLDMAGMNYQVVGGWQEGEEREGGKRRGEVYEGCC